MTPTTTTKSLSLIFFLLLSHALLSAEEQQRQNEGCPPFSCGPLQDISYPFRRRDDLPQCGESLYQLNCQGNKSTFSIGSVEYLVTDIRYNHFRLVDQNFIGGGGGSCGLPSQSLSLSTLDSFNYSAYWPIWASFMNCSKAMENEGMYWPISCPARYNSTYLYVVIAEFGFKLQYLPSPCQFISMIPVTEDAYNQLPSLNSTVDALSVLQHGFDLHVERGEKFMMIRRCLEVSISTFSHLIRSKKFTSIISSLVSSEIHFAICVNAYSYRTFTFWITAAVVVVIQIVQALIVLLVLGRIVAAPILIWLLVAYKLWSTQKKAAADTVEKFLHRHQMLMPTRYAYTDIIAITRHFKEKVGQGGFGSVFKGELAGGIPVAVKMMVSSNSNGDEFISEVSTIGRIHHVNVVRLVGFCSDGSKRALVYEFMSNSSLDKYIFFNRNGTKLHTFTSKKLINIAMGIARGIDYLHRGCDMQILHFDIKPHNILLDDNFTPKIADFGLAKLYPKDKSLVSISAARGTVGYIAPELISRSFGVISQKSDVYSYGMLLMEMAGRRRNVDPLVGNSSQVYYPSWIYDKLNQQQTIIPQINFEISKLEKKLAIVGLWCIQMKSLERPTMNKVIEMLESDVETIPMPPKPFFSSMDSILENKISLDSFSTELSVRMRYCSPTKRSFSIM